VKQLKDRKLTVYEQLRNETVDYLDACFRLESTSGSVFLTFLDKKLSLLSWFCSFSSCC